MTSSYFGDFQPEELTLLLSIPYRAGVWMSHVDDLPGTARDESKEEMALKHVLARLHDRAEEGSFVQGVLHEIIAHQSAWAGWGESYATVLNDTGRGLSLVDARLPESEAQQYRKCIFHVAKTVAMAAHEGPESTSGLDKAPGGGLLGRLNDWLSAKSGEQIPANISPSEKAALQELLQRLKKH